MVDACLCIRFRIYILAGRAGIMATMVTYELQLPIGVKARRLRISQLLTQRELADMAGVSQKEVDLFEHDLPVTLDARRRILKVLWARKDKK
jgi:DNA-binding XRE family transcriptional regulator